VVRVPGAGREAPDDEHRFHLVADGREVAEVVLRRTACRVNTWLVECQGDGDGPAGEPLLPETRAALLWLGWNHFRELTNEIHRLDVFDHTLLVLAGVEELTADPLGALLDPPAFVRRVDRSLWRQGLLRAPLALRPPDATRPDLSGVPLDRESLGRRLAACLDPESALMLKWVALLHDVGKPATRGLSRNAPGRPYTVQFLGHEVFGLHLLDDLLGHLFPDEADKARVTRLIRHHHSHHALVLDRYRDAGRLQSLKDALVRPNPRRNKELKYLAGHFRDPEFADFPLLTLHGFADLNASRGPDNVTPLGRVAEVDLLFLALWARREEWDTHPHPDVPADGVTPARPV
jgi:hypothetical protein